MATSDKLNKLLETKAAIKQAIIDKGVDIEEGTKFADYPAKISAIQTGSNGSDYTAVYLAQTSNGTNYKQLFYNCTLTEINLNGYDTSNVTDMSSMFYGCKQLTSLDLSGFDTSNVTTMNSMFSGCSSLTTLDVSNFDTSNVTTMGSMFYGCSNLTSLDVSDFNTSNVTTMNSMFSCQKLTKIEGLSNWNTNQVTDMGGMFSDCYVLEELDIRNFDMTNVTKTTYMFFSCRKLHTLRLDKCSNDTINKIITSSSFPTGTITDSEGNTVTRKIYVNPEKITDLTPPTNWKFYDCTTDEEIITE